MTGATGPRGPSDAYISEASAGALTPTLATVTTLTLPATGAYLVWAKASFNSTAATVRNVSCYLTTGADGSLDGAFDLSSTQLNPFAQGGVPLQGELFVGPGNGTTVRLQCQTNTGSDVFASGKLQAIKVASVALSP